MENKKEDDIMKKETLEFMNSYLDKLEEAENTDIFEVGPNRYENDIQDIIIEIGTIFEKEIPELKNAVFLSSDSLSRDINTTKGMLKKFLLENEYKKINKVDNQLTKFWTSFKMYFENELPYKDYLKSQFIGYNNWDGGVYYLDIDYNYQYKLHYGIEYVECTTINEMKMFIELAFSNWIEIEKRYDFTKDVNDIFKKFKMPFKLQKGKIVKIGYKTTNLDDKIINYAMLERKIQYAEEMILSSETLDKKCALDYIIDSLQYVISIQDGNSITDKYVTASKKISSDINGKVYAVVKNEINELMKISNEYFDIRHNEYLNKAKEKREAITDPIFIEYIYNRAYALLYILKVKQ